VSTGGNTGNANHVKMLPNGCLSLYYWRSSFTAIMFTWSLSAVPRRSLPIARYLLYTLERRAQSGLYIAFYHLLLVLVLYCYFRCIFEDPGEAARYKLLNSSDTFQGASSDNDERRAKYVTTGRFCGVCQQPKPERAHHCSECDAYRLSVTLGAYSKWITTASC
jgi:palmitoyltransferase